MTKKIFTLQWGFRGGALRRRGDGRPGEPGLQSGESVPLPKSIRKNFTGFFTSFRMTICRKLSTSLRSRMTICRKLTHYASFRMTFCRKLTHYASFRMTFCRKLSTSLRSRMTICRKLTHYASFRMTFSAAFLTTNH